MDEKLLEYARLLVQVGLNVQKGQRLVISSPVRTPHSTLSRPQALGAVWAARHISRAACRMAARQASFLSIITVPLFLFRCPWP